MQRLGVAQRSEIAGGETADGGGGRVGRRAIQGRPRPVLRYADDSRAPVAARDIAVAGDHGGRRDGNIGKRQGRGCRTLRRTAGLRSHGIAGHGRGRIGRRIRRRGRLRPGVGKLRRVTVLLLHIIVLVHGAEPHAPVRAVVILNDHRHGE